MMIVIAVAVSIGIRSFMDWRESTSNKLHWVFARLSAAYRPGLAPLSTTGITGLFMLAVRATLRGWPAIHIFVAAFLQASIIPIGSVWAGLTSGRR
jgi:hypothetical protein